MTARRASLLLAVSALLAGACAPSNDLNIGLKDYPTDVVYGDSATTVPEQLPAPFPGASLTPGFPGVFAPPPVPQDFSPPPPRPVEFVPDPCPIADSKSRVIAAAPKILGVPEAGAYSYKQQGSSKSGDAAPVVLPTMAERKIKNVKLVEGEPTFDVEIVEFGITTLTSYRVRRPACRQEAAGLYITRILQTGGKGPEEFLPIQPGLRIFPEPAVPGALFVSAATDPIHQIAMRLQGTVKETRKLDVCGVFVEAWVTDVTIGVRRPGTSEDDYMITASFLVATALGGLVIADSVVQTGKDEGVVLSRSTSSQLIDLAPHAVGSGGAAGGAGGSG